jgi:hypothetical protein
MQTAATETTTLSDLAKVGIVDSNPFERALPNKIGHSGRTAAAALGDELFQHAFAAPDANLVVVSLDLVNSGADGGAAKWHIGGQNVARSRRLPTPYS